MCSTSQLCTGFIFSNMRPTLFHEFFRPDLIGQLPFGVEVELVVSEKISPEMIRVVTRGDALAVFAGDFETSFHQPTMAGPSCFPGPSAATDSAMRGESLFLETVDTSAEDDAVGYHTEEKPRKAMGSSALLTHKVASSVSG